MPVLQSIIRVGRYVSENYACQGIPSFEHFNLLALSSALQWNSFLFLSVHALFNITRHPFRPLHMFLACRYLNYKFVNSNLLKIAVKCQSLTRCLLWVKTKLLTINLPECRYSKQLCTREDQLVRCWDHLRFSATVVLCVVNECDNEMGSQGRCCKPHFISSRRQTAVAKRVAAPGRLAGEKDES